MKYVIGKTKLSYQRSICQYGNLSGALQCTLTLIEFPTKFVIICRNLPGSPKRISGTLSETYTASYKLKIN
jgi:hypothetical protein